MQVLKETSKYKISEVKKREINVAIERFTWRHVGHIGVPKQWNVG